MKQAVAVIIRQAGKFLLIKRAKKDAAEDYWCPITGAVEPGETQEQAVKREAFEEMGIEVTPIKKVWECHTHDDKYVLHWWSAEMRASRIRMNLQEVKAYKWLSYEQMKRIPKMFKTDLEFFKNAARLRETAE
jgi:8-oxo-dGTP diphosphatase